LLELNARPGLSIQIANGRGLLSNLRIVEQLEERRMTVAQRAEFAKQHFGVFEP
jgi:hypothetical protein